MSDRLKYERFFWFDAQIKSERHPNSRHLAEYFEISPRTAQRDIEFMRDNLQAPLQYDHRKRGYFYTDSAFELPGVWLNETNMLALAFAVRLASALPDPSLKGELCRLLDRIAGSIGGAQGRCLNRPEEKVSVKNIEYARVNPAVFRQTVAALFADQPLRITYHSPHTQVTSTRAVLPLHLMHYRGSWHLIAWCAARRGIRNFALSRIRTLAPSDEMVALPPGLPPIKEYTRRNFGIMLGDSAARVTLAFSPAIAPLIAEQIWHPEQRLVPTPNGELLLSFPAADHRELTKIILGYGAEVRVVEPETLKAQVQEEITRMAKIYLPV